jgi:uncharacterized protein VirK/YbjX
MIKIFDSPEYMTVEEVKKKYYPHRVVLANCEERHYATTAGYAMAMETIPDDDYEELLKYQVDLTRGEKHGKVDMVLTRMPLEGEWLCVEFAKSDRVEA